MKRNYWDYVWESECQGFKRTSRVLAGKLEVILLMYISKTGAILR